MRKIVLAPDSFKGTMTSAEVCELMEEGIRSVFPDVSVTRVLTADGGEGTVSAVLQAVGGVRKRLTVKDPNMRDIEASYGIIHNGRTAVIEMAAASGLPLVGDRKDPSLTTTYGTGQLILDALGEGCREIILGVGGSATNDGGVGMAAALGFRFLDGGNCEIDPTGGGLAGLCKIDASGREPLIDQASVMVACDVTNPLCGPEGASYVFGPQKGADDEMVELLDRNLRHFATVIARDLGVDVLGLRGGGAAGGLGAGMVAFAGPPCSPALT
jgi:glycerate kinase